MVPPFLLSGMLNGLTDSVAGFLGCILPRRIQEQYEGLSLFLFGCYQSCYLCSLDLVQGPFPSLRGKVAEVDFSV